VFAEQLIDSGRCNGPIFIGECSVLLRRAIHIANEAAWAKEMFAIDDPVHKDFPELQSFDEELAMLQFPAGSVAIETDQVVSNLVNRCY
jgi:hypothetical protein